MMSAAARRNRRGGLSCNDFLAEMERLGFVEVDPRPGFLYEFIHPDTAERHYCVRGGSLAGEFERMGAELRAGRHWCGTA